MSEKDILQSLIDAHTVEEVLRRGSNSKEEIGALQTVVNRLGFGIELNWETYGADGIYGACTTRAVEEFCIRNGLLGDGQCVNQQIALLILRRYDSLPDDLKKGETGSNGIESMGLTINEIEEGGKIRVYINDEQDRARFTRYKKGLYTVGRQKTINVVTAAKERLRQAEMTDSAINVMTSVSENEGNLDAVNTWDNSFLSFGMFQWTLGARNDSGELAALLAKIKAADESVFEKYYGRFGIDIQRDSNLYGYFLLGGVKLATAEQKEQMRGDAWAFRFWKSGQDPVVQVVEFQHAYSRIGTFYWSDSYKVKGHYIADLVSSEYGVALLLDNHVNRPGYLKPCLESALEQTQLDNPDGWTSNEEMKLIEAYIKIRATYGKYPMTHADRRAAVTGKYLKNGTISAERGSFVYRLV
jgi:peptidoglycan hydrolase-like protein with peptidoglycan-binding domain